MYAILFPTRIDLCGGNCLPDEKFQLLLNDLKAEYVPGLMQNGRRSSTAVDNDGHMTTFVQRTPGMTDSEITDILSKHGISVVNQTSA